MAQLIPFDDRDGFIWLNGEMVPWREARVHVLTHGLHYGSCGFEGERGYGGRVFPPRGHRKPPIGNRPILGLAVPYPVEEIAAAPAALVARNRGGGPPE